MRLLAASIAIVALASIVLLCSMTTAQTQTAPTAPEWSFDGRPVIIERKGVHFGVSERVKLVPSENSPQFIVIRMNPNDSESFDYWQPLSDVSSIMVFDSLEDAKSYNEKHHP